MQADSMTSRFEAETVLGQSALKRSLVQSLHPGTTVRRHRMERNLQAMGIAILSGAVLAFCVSASAQQSGPSGSSAQPGPSGFLNTPGQNMNGMHVYLWAGLKSHGEGQHDYPQWLADWSKVLTEHGAVLDGALHGPG